MSAVGCDDYHPNTCVWPLRRPSSLCHVMVSDTVDAAQTSNLAQQKSMTARKRRYLSISVIRFVHVRNYGSFNTET